MILGRDDRILNEVGGMFRKCHSQTDQAVPLQDGFFACDMYHAAIGRTDIGSIGALIRDDELAEP